MARLANAQHATGIQDFLKLPIQKSEVYKILEAKKVSQQHLKNIL
jgi:hypothetical protein